MRSGERIEAAPVRLVLGAWTEVPWWYLSNQLKCKGVSDLFFPDGNTGQVQKAQKICRGESFEGDQPCPFLEECGEWAIARNEKSGVWGGMSERQRRRVRRARLAEAKAKAEAQVTRRVFVVQRRYTVKKKKTRGQTQNRGGGQTPGRRTLQARPVAGRADHGAFAESRSHGRP